MGVWVGGHLGGNLGAGRAEEAGEEADLKRRKKMKLSLLIFVLIWRMHILGVLSRYINSKINNMLRLVAATATRASPLLNTPMHYCTCLFVVCR